MRPGLDDIDLEAERVFGRTKQNRRVLLRRGLQREEDKRKFNAMFREVRNENPSQKCTHVS